MILGGNRSDSAELLAKALRLLESSAGRITRLSTVRTTRAWGFEAADFVNRAVELETGLTAVELLDAVQGVERELGRDRAAEAAERDRTGQRYASRPVDIDILFFGDEVVESERLTVPHREIERRMFVLEPLNEIVPELVHPVTGLTVSEMYERLMNDLQSCDPQI